MLQMLSIIEYTGTIVVFKMEFHIEMYLLKNNTTFDYLVELQINFSIIRRKNYYQHASKTIYINSF